MKITEIIEFLQDNGLSEIEEVHTEAEFVVLKCYYDFDSEEIKAARAYANEESDVDEESDEWYKDWYFSYLIDLAKDNVEEVFEEIQEEYNVSSNFKILQNEANSEEYVKFMAVFSKDSYTGDLEDIINDYI